MAQPAVKVGQVWVEMDPRMERYVRIEKVWDDGKAVDIRRVTQDGGVWPNARLSSASARRFNGNRGGYAIHSDI